LFCGRVCVCYAHLEWEQREDNIALFILGSLPCLLKQYLSCPSLFTFSFVPTCVLAGPYSYWTLIQRISCLYCYLIQDVVCPEAVKLDSLDPTAISSNFDAAKSAFNQATSGSVEQAEAQVDMEVNKAMGLAVGLTLA
jgi:hypothetical protein